MISAQAGRSLRIAVLCPITEGAAGSGSAPPDNLEAPVKIKVSNPKVFGFLLLVFFWPSCAFAQTPTPTLFPDFLLDHHPNGVIDSKDLLILIQRWGVQVVPTTSPTPTETPMNSNSFTVELNIPDPFPLKLVRIPAGSFMMGSPDTERGRKINEGPVHPVTFASDFYIGETEVTQAQWAAVMGSNPANETSGIGSNIPVYSVSWVDCQEFLAALNGISQTGTFRLPSEAEWEYACRAGTTTRFFFGNSLGCSDGCVDCEVTSFENAKQLQRVSAEEALGPQPKLPLPMFPLRTEFMWFCPNLGEGLKAKPVRSLRHNAFGLYDLSGNVFEWVQDLYHADFTGAPTDGSAWLTGGVPDQRVVRGGTYITGASSCRSAVRESASQTLRSTLGGFRVAWTP